MDDPREKETRGVPWADHNETESSPPDTRREEYGDGDSSQNADERAADHGSDEDRDPDTAGPDREQSARTAWGKNPLNDL